ncbi:unnamed protein product [Rotaria magnacalcarata]
MSRYELVHITEAQVREQVYKLYSNMYKQLFDTIASARPSSVASSTSLNFGTQQQQTNHNSSSVIKPMVVGSSPSIQGHHVSPPQPDKLMAYE